MPVKRKAPEKGKQEQLDASVQIGLSQLDLPGMSLRSLLQFGSSVLLKEAITAEITAYLGRSHYQHSAEGKRPKVTATAINVQPSTRRLARLSIERPKVAYAPDFKSQFHVPHMRRPEEFGQAVTDMYINGTSTRKVKDCLKAVTGKKI